MSPSPGVRALGSIALRCIWVKSPRMTAPGKPAEWYDDGTGSLGHCALFPGMRVRIPYAQMRVNHVARAIEPKEPSKRCHYPRNDETREATGLTGTGFAVL